ncbi:MAG TPA: hypothetical protein VGJ41_13975 [Nocardioides sp.]|jgi:hypothetical protein
MSRTTRRGLAAVAMTAGLLLGSAGPAGADVPPGQHGYEGQPGNQGSQHGLSGYEGQPGNQGG